MATLTVEEPPATSIGGTPVQQLVRWALITMGLWALFSLVIVPAVIGSAYRGESLPFFNGIISGRSEHPVEHYLRAWAVVANTGLIAGTAFWLLGFVVAAPGFARRIVGDATPGSLGAIRFWVCLILLLCMLSEDVPSIALLPLEMRQNNSVLHWLYGLPIGFDQFVASASSLRALQWTTILLLFVGMIGLWTRIVVPLAAVGVFFSLGLLINYTFFWHQGVVPMYVLMVLAFTPCGDGWSLDRLRRIAQGKPVVAATDRAPVYAWARFVAWVVIVPAYVLNGVSKLHEGGWFWWNSTNFRGMIYMDNLNPRWFDWTPGLYIHPLPDFVFAAIPLTAVVMEILFFLVLFSRVGRWIFAGFAAAMHAGIGLLQRFVFFDLVMLQFIFWDWTGARRAVAKRLAARRGPIDVLYDGWCPLCQRTVRLLTALDLFERLQLHDFRKMDVDAYARRRGVAVTAAALEREMFIVSQGRAYAGFSGYRVLALALPALWVAAPFLFLPGVSWVGSRVYGYVARNRTALLVCDSHCELDARGADAVQTRPAPIRRRLAMPLAVAAITVTSMVCWVYLVEFYPFTSWHLYSYTDNSGKVTYLKVFARYESGDIRPARIEDTIGAVAYDGRYWNTLKRCFDGVEKEPWAPNMPRDPATAAANQTVCRKFLSAAAAVYNGEAPPGRGIAEYRIEKWTWDFRAHPSDTHYGELVDRFVFDVPQAAQARNN